MAHSSITSSETPAGESTLGLAPTLSSGPQLDGTMPFNSNRPHQSGLVGGIKNFVFGVFIGVQNSFCYHLGLGHGNTPADAAIELGSQSSNDGEAVNNGQGSEVRMESVHHDDDRSATPEAGDLEANRPSDISGDDGFGGAHAIPSRRKWMLMAMLAVGVLALVVVPGVVVGVATRQMPWGIALSIAIVTVVGAIADLYYRHRA